MLAIQVLTADGITIMRPLSELTVEVVNQWRSRFQDRTLGQQLVIDLESVSFMDSAGLGVLVGGIRRVREGGGEVVLVCTRPSMRHLIQVVELDKIVEVTDDVETARHLLASTWLTR